MKVSVIVPVYNAAATLEKSLGSLRRQKGAEFEVIFIDDCSKDDSLAILQSFASGSEIPCKIIRQEKNRGAAAARNAGLDAAEGDYLAFLDADDSFEDGALAVALEGSTAGQADILGWDWTLDFEKNGRGMRQADYSTPLDALKNLMGGTMRWNLWLFMIRKDLIESNGIRFIDGEDMGEDMGLVIRCFLAARTVRQIHTPLYRYNAVSGSSISRSFSELRRGQIEANLKSVETAVSSSAYSADLKDHLQYLKLFLKLPLLISPDRKDYQTWSGWFPEANSFAFSNKALPLRTRLLQWMAAERFWFGVKMYYLCIHKFVYGVIFR